MSNSSMTKARAAKDDEFYTQKAYIENEMNAYIAYDPDVFRGKTVLLPCDDPERSKFTEFFCDKFDEFGLKKLISTSYAPASKKLKYGLQYTLDFVDNPEQDELEKAEKHGRIFVLEKDENGDGRVNRKDIKWSYLDGDGDFNSEEVKALRDEADIIITNPPFSKIREFVAWLFEKGEKQFSFIGRDSCLCYKETFKYFMQDRMWIGATSNNKDMVFAVPDGVPIKPAYKQKAAKLGYVGDNYTRLGNACWITNIQHGVRHEKLDYMTMAHNIKYSRHKELKSNGYIHYDNYDAIEVTHWDSIPSDYDGIMGIPPTTLFRFNPEMFEIVGITRMWFDTPYRTKIYPKQIQIDPKEGKTSVVTKLNDGATVEIGDHIPNKTYYEVDGKRYMQFFTRILIRHKK